MDDTGAGQDATDMATRRSLDAAVAEARASGPLIPHAVVERRITAKHEALSRMLTDKGRHPLSNAGLATRKPA